MEKWSKGVMEHFTNPIILALDVSSRENMEKLIVELSSYVGAFKIGLEMFTRFGPDIVKEALNRQSRVMLDLKLHDIPNTVQRATKNVALLGVDLLTIHAGGGSAMMRAAREAVEEFEQTSGKAGPKLLGVTVLTSIDQQMLRQEMGVTRELGEQVVALAETARAAGLDGVVASPKEIRSVRDACGSDFLIVTPGIRPAGSSADDQKRICTPGDAIRAGASYIVIGRPVLTADDPIAVLEQIGNEIKEASI